VSRSDRMFEIIQILRSASGALTSVELAARLEVHQRTVYRDIAALQAMRVPIEGEAGIGYILRSDYSLPPLTFEAGEIDAILTGLALVGRTGDGELVAAAARARDRISAGLEGRLRTLVLDPIVAASGWHEIPPGCFDPALMRAAIREERMLEITYRDELGNETVRRILPLMLAYFVGAVVLVAWCDLRQDIRHFRLDRIWSLDVLEERRKGDGHRLRKLLPEIQ
jgi:predicted DNA-binding transcriptional regulator YafY